MLEGLESTCLESYTVTVVLHLLRNKHKSAFILHAFTPHIYLSMNSEVSGTYFQATGTVTATIATCFQYGRGYVDQFLMGCAAGH